MGCTWVPGSVLPESKTGEKTGGRDTVRSFEGGLGIGIQLCCWVSKILGMEQRMKRKQVE